MNIQIRSIHFTADQKLLDHVEKKVSKVERFFPKVISAEVSLKLENSGQVRDKIVELGSCVAIIKTKSSLFCVVRG